MIDVNELLTIILYILGSILLVVLIVLGIKLIKTVNKVNNVVDEIDEKQKKLNGIFDVIDTATDTLSIISDKVVGTIVNGLVGIFSRKKKDKDLEEEENE